MAPGPSGRVPGVPVIFAPDLAAKISLGEKTVTRRPVVKRYRGEERLARVYEVGRTYAVQLCRGGVEVDRIRIVAVTRETLHLDCLPCLSWDEARAEGFVSPAAFWNRWFDLYGNDDPVDVWRIEFELVAE